MRKRPQYKIEEIRIEDNLSKFILKNKICFWWEKVVMHPYFHDPYTFTNITTAIRHIDRCKGELISIKTKINKKQKRKR